MGRTQTDAVDREGSPLSGEGLAAVPECIDALVAALAASAGASTMLAVLRRAEPSAAVALRLVEDDEQPWLLLNAPEGIAVHEDGGRVFASLAHEEIAPLPAPSQGTLHLAASTFDRLDPTGARLLIARSAPIVGAAVRLARAETRARALSEHAVQLEKLASLGKSATGIVHELNNPLTAIIAYSDYLSRKLHGHAEDSDLERLNRITEAAHRIQRYSRDLVDYSRPASGLRQPVDLHEVIDRALGFCMHGLRGAAIQVERSYGELPFVEGVDSPLTQVFVNLFTNSWHAMADTGGTLRIQTRAERNQVIVEVADDGPGIAAEHLARVFDAYFTTKPKGVGTGLGLSIVREIVGDHGGRIQAHNREPRGALFRVILPIPR
jgi:signal transduction histidine kinase